MNDVLSCLRVVVADLGDEGPVSNDELHALRRVASAYGVETVETLRDELQAWRAIAGALEVEGAATLPDVEQAMRAVSAALEVEAGADELATLRLLAYTEGESPGPLAGGLGPSEVLYDDFVEAANTAITAHAPNEGAAWTALGSTEVPQVQGGAGYVRANSNNRSVALNVAATRIRGTMVSTGTVPRAGVVLRGQDNGAGLLNGYSLYANYTSGGFQLNRVTNGSDSNLQVFTLLPVADTVYVLELELGTSGVDQTVTARVYAADGTTLLEEHTVTDNTYSGGVAGVVLNRSTSSRLADVRAWA